MSTPTTSKTTNPYIKTECIQEAPQFARQNQKWFVKYYYYYYYYSRAPFLMGKGIRDSCKQAPAKEHSFLQAPVSERERERERAFVFITKLGQRVVFNQ
jgi:hypothetical protein